MGVEKWKLCDCVIAKDFSALIYTCTFCRVSGGEIVSEVF